VRPSPTQCGRCSRQLALLVLLHRGCTTEASAEQLQRNSGTVAMQVISLLLSQSLHFQLKDWTYSIEYLCTRSILVNLKRRSTLKATTNRTACREAKEGLPLNNVYEFTDAREIEIAARCCRRWLDEKTLDPSATELAERITRGGLQCLPKSAYAIILRSSFLIDVQGSLQSGSMVLQVLRGA
jgi:hypothetical protein